MKKRLPAFIGLVLVGVLWWWLPPFHIRSLKEVRKAEAGAQFDAAVFVERFWNDRLLPATSGATEASEVLKPIASEPRSVRDGFGRTVGLSSSYYLFLRGRGRVVSADEDVIGLALKPGSDEAQVVIELGFVFGNAVRDGTGLLDPGDYPNAQEFNDISAALNSRVETSVLPRLQEMAIIGRHIQFAGCAEVADEESDLKPLTLVPISVEPE